ncbi:hypothetical protein ACWCQL_01535 [Streptomyces sp. NPDC002073]
MRKVKPRKRVATGIATARQKPRPSVEETTRALLAKSFPDAGKAQLDEAAELLARDLGNDAPEPEGDELTDSEVGTVQRLRRILRIYAVAGH